LREAVSPLQEGAVSCFNTYRRTVSGSAPSGANTRRQSGSSIAAIPSGAASRSCILIADASSFGLPTEPFAASFTAANLGLSRGRAVRMKTRPPVDYHLAIVKQIAPSPQTEGGETRCHGTVEDARSAPVQRLNMHRPERWGGLASLVALQAVAPPSFAAIFTQQFRFLQGVCIGHDLRPT